MDLVLSCVPDLTAFIPVLDLNPAPAGTGLVVAVFPCLCSFLPGFDKSKTFPDLLVIDFTTPLGNDALPVLYMSVIVPPLEGVSFRLNRLSVLKNDLIGGSRESGEG